jgi:hypothetical protein
MPRLARLDAPGVLHHVMGFDAESFPFSVTPAIQEKIIRDTLKKDINLEF